MPSNGNHEAPIISKGGGRRFTRSKPTVTIVTVPAPSKKAKPKTPARRTIPPSSRVTRSQNRNVHGNSTISPPSPPRQGLRRTDMSEANLLRATISVSNNHQRRYAPISSQDEPIPAVDFRAVSSRGNFHPSNSRGRNLGRSTISVTHAKPSGRTLVPGTQEADEQTQAPVQESDSQGQEEEGKDDDDDDDEGEDEDDDDDDDDDDENNAEEYIPPSGRMPVRSSLPGTALRGNAIDRLWIRPSSAPSSPLKWLDTTRKRPHSPGGSPIDVLEAHRAKHRRGDDGSRINVPNPDNTNPEMPTDPLPERRFHDPHPPIIQNMGQRYSDGAIGVARHSLAGRLAANQHQINSPHRQNPSPHPDSQQRSHQHSHASRSPHPSRAPQSPHTPHTPRTPRTPHTPRTPRSSRSTRSRRGGGYRWDGKRRSRKSPRPWHLGYYSPAAQGVLQRAREHVKQKMITENAFPDGQQKDNLTREAWEVGMEEKASLAANSSSLPDFNAWINRMLSDVLWEGRGRIISKARESVYVAFELAPPDLLDEGNPRRGADHRRQLTVDMVKLHLATWKFLFGKYQMPDDRIRRDIPFTHKGLWDLIYRAYFDPKPADSTFIHLNPIPAAAIVLASTAAFGAIKEYETGEHKTIEFTRPRFSVIYEDLFEKWIQFETERPTRAMNVRLRITAYCFERMGRRAEPEPDARRRPGRGDMFAPCGDDSEDDAPEQPLPSPQRSPVPRY